MSLVPGRLIRELILAAPILMAVSSTPAHATDLPYGPLSGVPSAAYGGHTRSLPHRPALAGSTGDTKDTAPRMSAGETSPNYPGGFPGPLNTLSRERKSTNIISRNPESTPPSAVPAGAGSAGDAMATSGTHRNAPSRVLDVPARDPGTGEDAVQTVPFLVGSGLILLVVAVLFRRTLVADRRLERARRSRPRQPAEHSVEPPGEPAPDPAPAPENHHPDSPVPPRESSPGHFGHPGPD